MRVKGKNLEFLKKIKPDGSGLIDVSGNNFSHYSNRRIRIKTLSIKEGTFITFGIPSFIVKFKSTL